MGGGKPMFTATSAVAIMGHTIAAAKKTVPKSNFFITQSPLLRFLFQQSLRHFLFHGCTVNPIFFHVIDHGAEFAMLSEFLEQYSCREQLSKMRGNHWINPPSDYKPVLFLSLSQKVSTNMSRTVISALPHNQLTCSCFLQNSTTATKGRR
jgi:hypothetical protein